MKIRALVSIAALLIGGVVLTGCMEFGESSSNPDPDGNTMRFSGAGSGTIGGPTGPHGETGITDARGSTAAGTTVVQ